MPADRQEATRLLSLIGVGEASPNDLMPLVYGQLRSLADRLMGGERANHTLQPTALVHEVFVRMLEGECQLGSERREFLAVAARAMRNLLVDHARQRKTDKRGGGWAQVTLSGLIDDPDRSSDFELLDLHEALEQLEHLDERQARIVEMSFFAGMTGQEIAEQLGLHRNSVVRELRMARAWLRKSMGERSESDQAPRP